ncbi:membrane protein [Cypionkella aquatica]|uniref:Membrane protein n=1 Tax=Cypionkella aquatica TaxID=1756042 RepID=A0AA37X0M5_9RHOB|nr:CDP-alcohol phosphatidyltransferase family protein [Cypionkella aquatica]GLS86914.1 membrane protein [Cypionkella aquatica]
MIDAKLLPLQRRLLAAPARWLGARMTADQISVLGFGLGALTVPALAAECFGIALILLVLNRLADGLDGAVARIKGATDRGAFLDIGLDFVFYALFPLGFALADPGQNALPAAVLISSFVGTGSSFLAFASIAAKRRQVAISFPNKGIYYLGGLTEGFETIAIFAAMALFPAWFAILAYSFAALCCISTLLRWRQGWLAFAD